MSDKKSVPSSSAGALSERAYAEFGGRRAETVASYDNPVMAEMAKARLETEGLAVRLADEHTVGVAGHLATAIGGVKVQVAEEDSGHAREILANMPDFGDELEVEAMKDGASPAILAIERRKEEDALAQKAPTATRALRAAVFSFFMPPLILLSLFYAARYASSEEEGGAGKVTAALLIDALLIGGYALIFSGF